MSEKKFSIVYNLEQLNEQQREQYKRDVSEFFGLDPATNWFDILWINDEQTGLKKLQLYARRGTTDVLRGQRGINVLSMTQHDGPGYVSFTAVGKDSNGRQEIAVGAHSTEGLKGEKLAAAVSMAETRAGRRLTLKFVGLGILDYSEINQDAPLSAPAPDVQLASSPLVFPPMPKISPNNEPGKDITMERVSLHDPNNKEVQKLVNDVSKVDMSFAIKPMSEEEKQILFEAEQAKMRSEAIAQLNAKHSVAQNPPIQGVSSQDPQVVSTEAVTIIKTRKPRGPNKKKNTVDIASPGQVSVPLATANDPEGTAVGNGPVLSSPLAETVKAAIPNIPLAKDFDPLPIVAPAFVQTQVNPAAPTQANAVPYQPILTPPAAVVPADFPGKPTKEQEEGYRAFLRDYANNILPTAGMVPSEGIGGASAKLRLFAERQSGKPTSQMTVDDWEELKAFFPGFLARNSPQNLVKYINDVIGTK
jgi:hypothetical protein